MRPSLLSGVELNALLWGHIWTHSKKTTKAMIMPRLTPEARLLKAQEDKANAISRLRSAAGQLSAKKRKMQTRQKIILGAMIMERMKIDPNLAKYVARQIPTMKERDQEALKGLEFAPQPTPPNPTPS